MSSLPRYAAPFAISLLSLALFGCLGGNDNKSNALPDIKLKSLSSAPEQVSGGDVLLSFEGDMALIDNEKDQLEILLNDEKVEASRSTLRNGRYEVLITGLKEGENKLQLRHAKHGKLQEMLLTNHPITGPIFSGPQQYPFVCTVTELGKQPLVDTDASMGFPVKDASGNQIGLSKDCSIETYVEFYYRTTGNQYKLLPANRVRPADMATTTLTDGRVVDFIVRREVGTINRFIYSFATLASLDDTADTASTEYWNGRALFQFLGGVAIGHTQGRMDNRTNQSMVPEVLGKGYAVMFSTGTVTDSHYNLQVGGETALMVKEHFIKRFGTPEYTVAIGGSGGGIQQYVYAQNHPGLLDGGVPQYSYPDMVTQTIHIGDCELLEHYMDATDKDNSKWAMTKNRSWLVGLNATDAYPDPLAPYKPMLGYSTAPGMTECVPAWRGLTPLVMNPHFGGVRNQEQMQGGAMDNVDWTHYDDLRNIYGTDEDGNPRTLFDNVGVQYGLQALNDHKITPAEFLKLNSQIGGWKRPKDMAQEGFPFLGSEADVMSGKIAFDPWSKNNMLLSADGIAPAPRTKGDLKAMNAAYSSGMVFDGELNIPVIDWRHYLEDVLDMHNSHQSFSGRQRIRNKMGHSDNQLIWFTDARPHSYRPNDTRPRPNKDFDQTWQALEVLHDWITNIRKNPKKSIAENKPATAVDSCFTTEGDKIASGDDVWDGILNDKAAGACAQEFPIHTTSRMVAGGPIEGGIFKCALKPVAKALTDGTYGTWVPDLEQTQKLEAIFPEGVCDYSKADQGRPKG